MYLDDGMRRYAYWIVVTNSSRSNAQVLRLAQGRGNQENLIKDCKYGLGLAHVPIAGGESGLFHDRGAWPGIRCWMLKAWGWRGDCQRFRYQWIWQAGVVAKTGRNTILLKLPAGEYLQRFGVALRRLAVIENRIRRGYPSLPGDQSVPKPIKGGKTGRFTTPNGHFRGSMERASRPMHLLLAHLAHLNRQIIPFRPTLCSTQAPYRLFWVQSMSGIECPGYLRIAIRFATPTG